MPNVLFIAAHRPGRSPSQRFRFEQYFGFLEENGFHCTLSYLIEEADDEVFYNSNNYLAKFKLYLKYKKKRINDVRRAPEFDLVFIQREAFMTGSTRFEGLFAKSGPKLIYDFDDAIWLPNVSDANKKYEWLKDYNKTSDIIALADHVIAGNQYLTDYASAYNNQVSLIPTSIDTNYHVPAPGRESGPVVIGWTGTSTTLRYFEDVLPELAETKTLYGNRITFKIIVDVDKEYPELGVRTTPWKRETEIADLNQMDIGLMPLPDNEWTRGKCGFKAIQYMALEKCTLVSPVGANREIVEHGQNGFWVKDGTWKTALGRLIEDAPMREQVGRAARQTIIDRYSVEANKHRYLQLLTNLLGQS